MNETKIDEGYDELKIQSLCALIDSVIKVIKKPRRMQIIKLIYNSKDPLTFEEIEKLTEIPRGSLHNNLDKLYMTEIISKTNERPTKYYLTEFAKELFSLTNKK